MANADAPRGFEPRRYVDGSPYNGALNSYKLASGYSTAIYKGDRVKLVSGKIQKAAATDQCVGVLAGVKYLTSSSDLGANSFWPASTVTYDGNDAEALVVDDPNVLFVASFTNSTSAPAEADRGKYFNHFDAGGNAMWGVSGEGVDYSTATTTSTSGVVQFVDFERQPDNDATSAYSKGLFRLTKHDRLVNSGAA